MDEEENTFLMQTELGTVIVHRGELTTPVYAEMNVTVYFDGVMALSEPRPRSPPRKIEVARSARHRAGNDGERLVRGRTTRRNTASS